MNDDYLANVGKIRDSLAQFQSGNANDDGVELEGFDEPFFLTETLNKSTQYLSAFDMKVNLATYCKVVQKRMEDEIQLELRYALAMALLRNLRSGLLKANIGQDLATLMEENAFTHQKRQRLLERVALLEDCKKRLQQLDYVPSENQDLCGTSY